MCAALLFLLFDCESLFLFDLLVAGGGLAFVGGSAWPFEASGKLQRALGPLICLAAAS